MKRIVLASLFAPVVALAQEAPPVSLDPSATGSQAPRTTAPAASGGPARSSRPDVVVVKPDGTMTFSQPQDTGPNRHFVGGGDTPYTDENDQEVNTGPTPELHVVRTGDTLWDICWFYFNDPWQWPKVWSYNPQITNPHWIYPGDLVRLLPRGIFSATPDLNEPEKPTGPIGTRPVDLPPPQRRTEVGLKQTAFVEKSNLDKSITLDGAVDEKALLATGDSVYLTYPANNPPKIGQRYSIYEPDQKVKEGAYVKILGTLEVVSLKQDKRARGVIVDVNQEIERGAKVGPLVKQYKTVPPVAPKVDAQGTIIAMLNQSQLIGQGELLFVDLGKGSGIEVGNRMFVVRRGDALVATMDTGTGQDDRRFPARALGEVVIVDIGDKVSVGLVTLAIQEMGVGDIVMMQKAASK